jgi:hypothetical protein
MENGIDTCVRELNEALVALRAAKPDERSETAQRFAVTITDLEKVIGYFETWIVREQDREKP